MTMIPDQCYASCPPSTVTIQPPPFVLTIPGPALYCPDQPMGIQQYNPCANVYGGGGMRLSGGNSVSGGVSEAVLAAIGNDDEEQLYRPWRRPPYWGPRQPWWSRPWRPYGRNPYGRGPWGGSCLEI